MEATPRSPSSLLQCDDMAAFNLALSNTGFTRWYIDGFAGTGEVNIKRDRIRGQDE